LAQGARLRWRLPGIMLQWFQRLMPHQRKFFPLFEQHAALIEQAAYVLHEMLDDGAAVKERCRAIGELEQRADDVAREVLLGIRTSFITPFDRIDIRNLISRMDDTIDQMNKSAQAIIAFELTAFEPEMQELSAIITGAARLVRKAVPLLSELNANATRLSNACVEISRLEERGDEIYARGRQRLFQKTRHGPAMAFIQGNEVYTHLDQVVDDFDDVGNEIQGIVVEHV
jgi:predicted phosphate transport protein (TIGR00153 family)